MSLKIGDQKYGRDSAWKFTERIQYILGLERHALSERLVMDLCGGTNLFGILPWTRRIGMKRTAGAEFSFTCRLHRRARPIETNQNPLPVPLTADSAAIVIQTGHIFGASQGHSEPDMPH